MLSSVIASSRVLDTIDERLIQCGIRSTSQVLRLRGSVSPTDGRVSGLAFALPKRSK